MNEKLTEGRLERPLAFRTQYRTSEECFTTLTTRSELSFRKSNVCIQGLEKDKLGEEENVTAEVVTLPRKSD